MCTASAPGLHERHVEGAPRVAPAQIERPRRPEQRDAVGRVVRVQRQVLEERLHELRQLELLVVVDHWVGALLVHLFNVLYCIRQGRGENSNRAIER